MINDYLKAVEGIPFLATMVLIAFFVLFLGVVWWAFSQSREEIDAASHLPLEKKDEEEREVTAS